MAVRPDHQRQETASMTMQRVCEEMDLHRRHPYVMAEPEAVRLYAKFGFEVVGKVETSKGPVTSMVRMPRN
jgi:predicted N-acetyltransferase YhbS